MLIHSRQHEVRWQLVEVQISGARALNTLIYFILDLGAGPKNLYFKMSIVDYNVPPGLSLSLCLPPSLPAPISSQYIFKN